MWISYASPAFACLLFAIPVFISLFIGLTRYRRRALKEFFSEREPGSTSDLVRFDFSSTLRGAFLILAYTFGVLALMDPLLQVPSEKPVSEAVKVHCRVHDVVFLLDVSASMGVKDGRLNRSRLDYAKEVIDEVAAKLNGESAFLFTFTSKTVQLVPGTLDYLYLRQMLRDVEVNSTGITGTDLKEALRVMYAKFWAHPASRKVTVILVSDGGDTAVEDLKGSARQKGIDQITAELHRHGTVDVIGVGSQTGGIVPGIEENVQSRLAEDVLEAIATAGKGHYYRAADFTSADLAQQLVTSLQKEIPPSLGLQGGILLSGNVVETEVTHHSLFQLFLGIPLLFLAIALLWPAGKILLVLVWTVLPLGLQADDETLESSSRRAWVYMQARDFERAEAFTDHFDG